jgi:uncharacterized protein YecE (DUF72 family)
LYDSAALNAVAARLVSSESSSPDVWFIFDNTAENAAIQNALELSQLVVQLKAVHS